MTNEPTNRSEVLTLPWIGLVEVAPGGDSDRESQLLHNERAFSIFIAFGVDREDALSQVEKECELMNLEAIEYEDVEPLEDRLRKATVHEGVTEMFDWMSKNKIGASLYGLRIYPADSE